MSLSGNETPYAASSPGVFAVVCRGSSHDQSQLLPLFSLTDDLVSCLALTGGQASGEAFGKRTEEMSSPPRSSSPSSSAESASTHSEDTSSHQQRMSGRLGFVPKHSSAGGQGKVHGSSVLASLDASGTAVAPHVASHVEALPMLRRDSTTGLDLNIAPSNWLTRDEKHLAHLHSLPWHPVTSGFSMVDYFSGLASGLSKGGTDSPSSRAPLATLNSTSALNLDDGSSNMERRDEHSVSGDMGRHPAWAEHEADQDHQDGRKVPDFLCSASQLKALLSSSVSGEALSFVVHRVGPSIILEGATTPSASRSVKQARHDALRSKLLYYSILADSSDSHISEDGDGEKRSVPASEEARQSLKAAAATASTSTSVGGSNAAVNDASPSWSPFTASASSRVAGPAFSRSLHWKIADLSLMLGVNVPIVVDRDSGEELTLQVHDEQDYITKAEAVDMWLDNIMSNVSGAAICFHRDGVVQGYQVVSTQDLPNLTSSSSFEPLSIQRDATNVLRWLKQECNQTGSYVIIKEPHDSLLKLYDVSSWHVSSADDKDSMEAVDKMMHLASSAEEAIGGSTSFGGVGTIEGSVDEADAVTSPLVQSSNTTHEQQASNNRARAGSLRRSQPPSSRDPLRPFAMPMAMMCFRMAQCLRNSDAECLRLYQKVIAMIPEDTTRDARAMLPLATAHAQCMNHYHSSSPLSDAEALTVSHGKSALRVMSRLLLEFMYSPPGEQVDDEAAAAGAERERGGSLFASLVTQADVIAASVSRCFCGLTLQHVRQRRYGAVVEMIAAVEQCMRIRIVCAAHQHHILRETKRGTSSGSDASTTAVVTQEGTSATPNSTTEVIDDDLPSVHLLRQQLSATSLQLQLAIGDFCLDLYRDAVEGHLTDVFIQDLTLHAKFASIQRDVTWRLIELCGDLVRSMPGGLKLVQTFCSNGGGGGGPADTAGSPSSTFSLAHELESAIGAEAAGPTEYRRVAEACFQKAIQHSNFVNHPTHELSRKLGMLHTMAGSASLNDSTLPRYDQVAVAHQRFSVALEQFKESGDVANSLLASLNLSKMELRFAQAFFVKESEFPEREEERLFAAIHCVSSTISWATNTTLIKQNRQRLVGQNSWMGPLADDSPLFHQVYLHLTNACTMMISRVLASFHRNRTCSHDRHQRSPSPTPPGGDALQHQQLLFSPATSWEAFHALSMQAVNGTTKDCEHFVHQQLLLPAIHFAKKAGSHAETRALSISVDLHLRSAGVRSFLTECDKCQPTETGRCQSLRWAIARSRQLLAAQQKLRDSPIIDLLISLAEGHCVILSCYVQLLKHVKALVQLELAEEGALNASGSAASAISGSTTIDCVTSSWEPLPRDVDEAQVEIVERAATTLCATRPILMQLLQNEGELRRVGKKSQVEGLARSVAGFVSPVLVPLLRMMKKAPQAAGPVPSPQAALSEGIDKISAVIKRSLLLLQQENLPIGKLEDAGHERDGLGITGACVELLSAVATDVFQGKMKKPTSKFF